MEWGGKMREKMEKGGKRKVELLRMCVAQSNCMDTNATLSLASCVTVGRSLTMLFS